MKTLAAPEFSAKAELRVASGQDQEPVRSVEEPVRLEGILDAGPETEPVDGADLQRVEHHYADGHGGQAGRGNSDAGLAGLVLEAYCQQD